MRKTVGAFGILLVAGLAALPVAAEDVTDWGGFYATVFAGYGLDSSRATSSVMPPTTYDLGGGKMLTFGGDSGLTRINGLMGGVGTGYNFQHGALVLGIESAFHLGNLGKTAHENVIWEQVDGADFIRASSNTRTDVDIDWYTTLTGTAGVTFEQGWLAYLKGGVALANVSTSSTASANIDANVALPIPANMSQTSSSSGLAMGPAIGFGVEKMIADNVSLGAEYGYVGLPDQTVTTPSALGFFGGGGGAPTIYKLGFHTVSATLKYHF